MKLQELVQVSDEEKRAVIKAFNMTEDEFEDCVEILWDWYQKTELHVEYINRNHLRNAFMNSKGSIEKAKDIIRAYFQIRDVYSTSFYKLILFTKEYNQSKSFVKFGMVPKLTPDLTRVFVTKFNDPNGEASDGMIYQLFSMMSIDFKLKYKDYFLSNVVIIDLDKFGLPNMMKYTPTINQALVNISVSLKLRIKNIHLINPPPFINKLILLFKTVLPTKLSQKLVVHISYDSLYKYIPKEYLPSNYGGCQPSLEELNTKWAEVLENEEDYFKKLDNIIKSMEKNTIESRSYSKQFGISCEGSFRKLAID